MQRETIALHVGYVPEATTKAVAVPIYQTVAYAFDSAEHGAALFDLGTEGFRYSRIINPTTAVLERREDGVASLCVATVGGFRGQFPYLEYWDLFVRLALAGARLVVLPKVLVTVNTSRDQVARRGDWRYAMGDIRFRTFCWRSGFLRLRQYVAIVPAFLGYRLAGGTLRNYLYRIVRTAQS